MKNYSATALILGSALLAVGISAQSGSSYAQEAVKAQEPVKAEAQAEKKKESKAQKLIDASKSSYVGASKCKSCHNKETRGKVYDKWDEMAHARAFETLATPEAIELGKKVGIKEPQKSDDCLKCHLTEKRVKKEQLHRKFKVNKGVQCETCHGPGSEHVKTRLKEAKANKVEPGTLREIPEHEMILPDEMLCRSCHNEESPSFVKFDFDERLGKIRHLHPKREKPRVFAPKKKDAKKADAVKKDE